LIIAREDCRDSVTSYIVEGIISLLLRNGNGFADILK